MMTIKRTSGSSAYVCIRALILSTLLIANTSVAETKLLYFSSVTNGEPFLSQGMDVLSKAYRCVGDYQIEVRLFPAKRALAVANSGGNDGELIRPKLVGKFENLKRVDAPLFSYELIAVSKTHETVPGPSLNDFRKHRVGIIRGFQSTKHIPDILDTVVFANDGKHLVKMLANERIDYAFMMKQAAIKAITAEEFSELKVLSPAIETKWFYHFPHRKNWHLIPKLEHCLRKITFPKSTDSAPIEKAIKKAP